MSDAYKIGVSVVLGNLMSAELMKIIGQLGVADKATMSFASKVGLASGAILVLGAAIKGGVDEARKFQIEATRFASLGFGDAVNTQAQEFAKGMRTLGTSSTENMALVSDAMAVFKNLDHAEMAAPFMAKMKFANETLYGAESGGANDKKLMDMLKVIEFRGGLNSDAEFQAQGNAVQQVINGSRNRVDATQLLMALKTGGVSLSRLSNEAFYLDSEPLIQEFGGSRYGTANMSAYQNLVMMRTTQQTLTELMRLNLLDKDKVEFNSYTGKVKRAQPGAFKGAKVLEEEGDLAFLEKVLLPAFAAKGITSDEAIIQEIGRIFSNRTASGLFARVYQQRATLLNQETANRKAMNADQTAQAADATLDGQIKEMDAQWHTLEQRFGGVILPYLISLLKGLNEGFEWLEHSPAIPKFFDAMLGADKDHPSTWTSWIDSKLSAKTTAPPPANSDTKYLGETVVKINGTEVGRAATTYQVSGMATVQSGGSAVDGYQSYIPVH